MGIQNLSKSLERYAPGSIRRLAPGDLRGHRLAVDAPIWVCQFFAVHMADTDSIAENDAVVAAVVDGILSRIRRLVTDLGVSLVCVFDGTAPECKQAVVGKSRAAARARLEQRAAETADPVTRRRLIRQAAKPSAALSRAVAEAIQETWRDRGDAVTVMTAPHDAEAHCAALCRGGDNPCWGVVTEDTDCLAFGAPRQIRGCSGDTLCHPSIAGLTMYTLEDIHAAFGWSHATFVDFCVLSGCDFTPSIPGIGPAAAYRLLNKHGSIQHMLAQEPNIRVPTEFDPANAPLQFLEAQGV